MQIELYRVNASMTHNEYINIIKANRVGNLLKKERILEHMI